MMLFISDFCSTISYTEEQIMNTLKKIKKEGISSFLIYSEDAKELKKIKESEFKLLEVLKNSNLIFLSEKLFSQTLYYEKGYEEVALRRKGLEYLASLEEKYPTADNSCFQENLDLKLHDQSQALNADETKGLEEIELPKAKEEFLISSNPSNEIIGL